MNTVRARDANVKFDRIAPAGFRILSAIDQAAQRCGVDLVITSGTDSHKAPDPHATGEAYDVSVRGLTTDQVLDVHASLKTTLGPLFTVLFECKVAPSNPSLKAIAYLNPKATGQHFHVQRLKGTVYPPPVAKMRVVRA